jgi:hypothetical protein
MARGRRPRGWATLGLCALLAVVHGEALAQESGRKQATALRVEDGAIRLDGSLDESVWRQGTPVTDFLQKEPVEGAPATEPIEIRFAFDGAALYVGARMYSADASTIQAPMGRRDNVDQAEYFQLSLDTYLDRRTAYTFGVTASGVRFDHYHAADSEGSRDATYDPVWQARTRIVGDGWTAELWIPFSQLRFNDVESPVWGLHIRRWIPTRNEVDDWVVIGRTAEGWASRFGELRGLDGVRPSPRLEVVPYFAGSVQVASGGPGGSPRGGRLDGTARVGADIKMSVGSSLTLDATVNPDFGQVEADPAEVNLTVNETFFNERRPFFLEGGQLLAGASNNFFYSRRIGATPRGPASGDRVEYPQAATIIGAAKLTGRLPSGTSIGILGAVTAEEAARLFTVGQAGSTSTRVAPRAVYGVGRVQQDVGGQGSTIGVHLTALHRDLPDGDPLASLLVRNAVSGAADALLRFGEATYEGRVVVGFSHVSGTASAIEGVQRTSVHYFQRPDRQGGPLLDTGRTSLTGIQVRSNFDRIAGRHWLWGVTVNTDSPEFETNDVGRLTGAGELDLRGRLTYRETEPGRLFRAYAVRLETERSTDWDGGLDPTYTAASSSSVTLPNFWVAELGLEFESRGDDPRLTRGGPAMGTPRRWTSTLYLGNNAASETQWAVSGVFGTSESGDVSRTVRASLSLRPAPAWQLSIEPSYAREREARQFVTRLEGGGPETFGGRYVFGVVDRSTVSMRVRFNYTFKPDLNLDFYAEPFAASGHYVEFGELLAARSRDLRPYQEGGTTPDFNVRSFRSNLVLRWEWRPGSTAYVVWQQDRTGAGLIGERAGAGSLWRALSGSGANILAVKASVWISRS